MLKIIGKKLFSLVGSLFLIAALFSGCTSQKEASSTTSQMSAAATPAPVASTSPSPLSRLPEILDEKKYADQFTVRVFNIQHKESGGKISSGDAILIRTPDGITMMIDSGYKEEIPEILDQMKKLGITKLDYIVATHMHPDHVGGFPTVLNTLPVGKVLSSKYIDFDFVNAKNFMSMLKIKNMSIDVLKEGDTFLLGKAVKVEVLSPEDREDIVFTGDSYSNQDLCNDQSIVLKMTYGNNTFLFTGDIQMGTEQRLVEKYGEKLKVDVLKGAHHGYNTSSGTMFMKAVTPANVLVSQALMVNGDVLQRYKNAGSKVYVTGLDGVLLAASDGKQVTIVTEKDRKPGAIKP